MIKKVFCLFKDRSASSILFSPLIFIILNLLFIGVLLVFVFNSASGAVIYEEAYAKEIVLIIDSAKPNMEILLDIKEPLKIAKKNQKIGESISLDNVNNEIKVSLAERGGYVQKYFTDYLVDMKIQDNFLLIKISEKEDE